MTETFFFGDWHGRTVTLAQHSAWRLQRLLSEKNDQLTSYQYNVDSIYRGSAGGAYATFEAQNVGNGEIGIIMVLMQVPYQGSEYAVYEERTRQATTVLTENAEDDLNLLFTLTRNQCRSAPGGGFLHYVLIEKAPGIQLSEDRFWAYPREERDRIRDAFKRAWAYVLPNLLRESMEGRGRTAMTDYNRECLRAGFRPYPKDPNHLFWNPASREVFIAGFRGSPPTNPQHFWKDSELVLWHLAKSPDENRIIFMGPPFDMSR